MKKTYKVRFYKTENIEKLIEAEVTIDYLDNDPHPIEDRIFDAVLFDEYSDYNIVSQKILDSEIDQLEILKEI